jgi:molybdopterin-containing oxidoreductase family membrane subunit
MNKFLLATGWMVAYGYITENFLAWYSGNPFEMGTFHDRWTGHYRGIYYTLVTCNVLAPQLFWWRRIRTSIPAMWIISILVNVGMWTERFIIVVQSLHHDFMPSMWRDYAPTWVDLTLFAGTLGFFSAAFLLFLRFVPPVSVSEVKELRADLLHAQHSLPDTAQLHDAGAT